MPLCHLAPLPSCRFAPLASEGLRPLPTARRISSTITRTPARASKNAWPGGAAAGDGTLIIRRRIHGCKSYHGEQGCRRSARPTRGIDPQQRPQFGRHGFRSLSVARTQPDGPQAGSRPARLRAARLGLEPAVLQGRPHTRKDGQGTNTGRNAASMVFGESRARVFL